MSLDGAAERKARQPQGQRPVKARSKSLSDTFRYRNGILGFAPSIVLAAEHYNMLVRLAQAGVPVQLRIELGARSYPELEAYNARLRALAQRDRRNP